MAEIRLPGWIRSISGRVGDYVFRTQNGKTFMYYQPKRRRYVADKQD